ncbi:MAG: SAM-dependent DNA methyltransferase [Candidatus Heimdallarchaeota archaeon]|nr:MAG: SAM-dependent DNA methyltransferase [Candidatus Heimdallarchaeota archaeon]
MYSLRSSKTVGGARDLEVGKKIQDLQRKSKGQFFTPKTLVQAILERIIHLIPQNKSRQISVLDPAIGKGVFFYTLIPQISSFVSNTNFYGIDIDASLIKIAKKELTQLVEKASYKIKIFQGDFLLNFPSDLPNNFDIIIGNPPHNALYSQLEWIRIRKNCHFGNNSLIYSESSVFFTLQSLNLLRPDGILCFLLPKPIIYSKRWSEFRKILLTEYQLVEVLDLGNQFSGQLQEQCAIIIKKGIVDSKNQEYQTGIWNPIEKNFGQMSTISYSEALMVDNFLVGVSDPELKIIHRLYSDKYEFLDVVAFRGLTSKYRVEKGFNPLIEKVNIAPGFLLPPRSFLKLNTPRKRFMRQKTPKIIAQRIISYHTKPKHSLDIKTWVDREGVVLTFETVINIIPNYSEEILSLNAIAGLLQSSFIEWWLRHAVYTKQFVTSKDFDKAYVSLIRIPLISDSDTGSIEYRNKLSKLLQFNEYEKIIREMEFQSDIDKLFTLGKIYHRFQDKSEELKDKISKLLLDNNIKFKYPREMKFQNFRWFYRHLREGNDWCENLLDSTSEAKISQYFNQIITIHKEIQLLKKCIDEGVFSLYIITPNEKKVVQGEII